MQQNTFAPNQPTPKEPPFKEEALHFCHLMGLDPNTVVPPSQGKYDLGGSVHDVYLTERLWELVAKDLKVLRFQLQALGIPFHSAPLAFPSFSIVNLKQGPVQENTNY